MPPPDPLSDPVLELFDPSSAQLLALCEERSSGPGSDGKLLSCLRGNGALRCFYFGRGNRVVYVRRGANEGVTGRLETRWAGGRREWLLHC
jgi:hypothetical protein